MTIHDLFSFVVFFLPISFTFFNANGSSLSALKVGSYLSPDHYIFLTNVYHVCNLSLNLFSVGKFVDSSFDAPFSPLGCSAQDWHTKKVVRIGRRVNRLFCLDHLPSSPVASTPTTLSCISFDIWYKRLGHASSAKSVMCFSFNMILIRKVIVGLLFSLIDFVIITTLHSFNTHYPIYFQSPFDSNLSSTPPIGDPIL